VYWPAIIRNPWLGTFTPRSVAFVIRSRRAGTEAFVNEVQQSVWSVNADLPVAAPRTMQEIYGKSLARTSFTLVMLAIAGAMALALGIIGIYGVISYAVSQRTREIGIRLALGAQKDELKWMFVRSALVLTGVGLAIGVPAIRHQPAGSFYLHCNIFHPGVCRGACQLFAGSPCSRSKSSGGPENGIVLCRR
jgi:cell division protein FtsX